MTARYPTDWFSWRHLSWQQLFLLAAALLSVALLVSAYASLPGLNVFGHDEVHYYPDWSYKLLEEGRWLNFFLHDFLRSIPPGSWAVVFLFAAWVFFFRLCRSLQFDAPYAVLVASTILLASPFVEQSLWPATATPAVTILLLAGVLAEREVPYPAVYVGSGILMFGAMQNFYFLVPLLFLGHFLDSGVSGRHLWLNLLRHLLWWLLGAVLGALVVCIIVWLKTGHFGVQLAPWRRTQPIHDVAGLLHNIEYVTRTLRHRTGTLLQNAGVHSAWFILALGAIGACRVRALTARPQPFVLIAVVAAGFFVFSIPLAPVIEKRSLQALGAAFVVFIACLPGATALGRTIGAVLLLIVCYGFSTYGESYLARHRADTDFFYYKLQQLIPGSPERYSSVALLGLMSDEAPGADMFNSAARMHGIFHALGVQRFRDCRASVDSRCENLAAGPPIATLPLGEGQLVFSVNADNDAVVHYIGTDGGIDMPKNRD